MAARCTLFLTLSRARRPATTCNSGNHARKGVRLEAWRAPAELAVPWAGSQHPRLGPGQGCSVANTAHGKHGTRPARRIASPARSQSGTQAARRKAKWTRAKPGTGACLAQCLPACLAPHLINGEVGRCLGLQPWVPQNLRWRDAPGGVALHGRHSGHSRGRGGAEQGSGRVFLGPGLARNLPPCMGLLAAQGALACMGMVVTRCRETGVRRHGWRWNAASGRQR